MLNLDIQECKHPPNLAAEIGRVSQLPQRFWKETRGVLYCLIYVSNTIALVPKKKYYHYPIKIKYIIYKETPEKHKSPTLNKSRSIMGQCGNILAWLAASQQDTQLGKNVFMETSVGPGTVVSLTLRGNCPFQGKNRHMERMGNVKALLMCTLLGFLLFCIIQLE